MEIVKLPPGTRAGAETDCISIQELSGGRFSLNGSVLVGCPEGDVAESQALIGGDPYDSYEAAEAAGLAWADELCAETVYVSRSLGSLPLPDFP